MEWGKAKTDPLLEHPERMPREEYLPGPLEVSGVGLHELVRGDILHSPRGRHCLGVTNGAMQPLSVTGRCLAEHTP